MRPSLLKSGELLHGVDVARVLEHPPMELQEVDRVDAEALQALGDAGAHHLRGHRPGRGAPFREGGWTVASRSRRVHAQETRRRSVRRCRNGRPCRSCRSPRGRSRPSPRPRASRSRARPSRSMSATCHRPVTTRLISRPGASRVRSGRRDMASSGRLRQGSGPPRVTSLPGAAVGAAERTML